MKKLNLLKKQWAWGAKSISLVRSLVDFRPNKTHWWGLGTQTQTAEKVRCIEQDYIVSCVCLQPHYINLVANASSFMFLMHLCFFLLLIYLFFVNLTVVFFTSVSCSSSLLTIDMHTSGHSILANGLDWTSSFFHCLHLDGNPTTSACTGKQQENEWKPDWVQFYTWLRLNSTKFTNTKCFHRTDRTARSHREDGKTTCFPAKPQKKN